jgi:hypothetical protein
MAFGWQVVGSLPTDLTPNSFFFHRGFLYAMGVHDFSFSAVDNVTSQCFAFKAQGDGGLGRPVISGGCVLNATLFAMGVAATGDYAYCMGGEMLAGANYQNNASVVRLNADGSAAFLPQLATIFPTIGDGECAIIGNYLYAYTTDGNGNTSVVYSSKLDPNGGFGPFVKLGDGTFQVSPGAQHPKLMSWGNYLFCAGGADLVASATITKISSARVDPTSGSLATGWKYVGDMSLPRFRHGAAINQNTGVMIIVGGTTHQPAARVNTPNCETFLCQNDGTVVPGFALPPLPTGIAAPARNAMVAFNSDTGWAYAVAGQGSAVIDPTIYAIRIGANGQAI